MRCGITFTSIEAVDLSGSVTVKNNKALEPFQRDKLLLSIYDSLKHRKSALSDATGLTDTIIYKLYPHMQDAIIDRDNIIKIVAEVLKRFDKAAASYYRSFHPGSST